MYVYPRAAELAALQLQARLINTPNYTMAGPGANKAHPTAQQTHLGHANTRVE